jgi:hypothetical protein
VRNGRAGGVEESGKKERLEMDEISCSPKLEGMAMPKSPWEVRIVWRGRKRKKIDRCSKADIVKGRDEGMNETWYRFSLACPHRESNSGQQDLDERSLPSTTNNSPQP